MFGDTLRCQDLCHKHEIQPQGRKEIILRQFRAKYLKKMVPLDSETSNTIFEIFEDWSYQLEYANITTLDFELEEETEEPKR